MLLPNKLRLSFCSSHHLRKILETFTDLILMNFVNKYIPSDFLLTFFLNLNYFAFAVSLHSIFFLKIYCREKFADSGPNINIL